QAGFLDGVHQSQDVVFAEPAAEVARGGGVGDALSTQGVEKDFVVAEPFEMLDPLATGEDVESEVQDMVGLVIGEMTFEQMELVVDGADQAGLVSQEQHGADAASGEAGDALAQLVVDVAGGDHALVTLRLGEMDQSFENSPLPLPQEPAIAYSELFPLAFSLRLPDNNDHSK